MASVYRAWDERLKRHVAVKLIAEWLARDPVSVRRFRREAELSARLGHPNIVAILDAGGEPHEYIVMEFVNGVHAGTLLQRRELLRPAQIVHVVAQVSDALAYAHDQDVVHHDVSPRNILIRRPDSTAKLADFGLASAALDVPARRAASVMGTPGYVAPEVLRGASASPRSDLYSLGVVAYRLLAGRSGVRPVDAHATAPQATSAPRMPPLAEARPDLSRGLIEAIQQALAHDPDARQDSVAEFRAQLLDGQSAPLRLAPRRPALSAA
jgi:serine/threonine-protein kinase